VRAAIARKALPAYSRGMSTVRAEHLYDEDFFAWTQLQAKELRRFGRTRPNVALDVRHIAEEIADLGKERRDSLRSWTARIIEHLLLLQHSPAREPRRRWIDEVVNFRGDIERRLTRSLRRDLERRRQLLYAEARRNLQRKLERYGEAEMVAHLPDRCPWTFEQILVDFWPPEPD
jgi:Domain of unknown function DUF29